MEGYLRRTINIASHGIRSQIPREHDTRQYVRREDATASGRRKEIKRTVQIVQAIVRGSILEVEDLAKARKRGEAEVHQDRIITGIRERGSEVQPLGVTGSR